MVYNYRGDLMTGDKTELELIKLKTGITWTKALIESYFCSSEEEEEEEEQKEELTKKEIDLIEKYYRVPYEQSKEKEEKNVVVTFAAINCYLTILMQNTDITIQDLALFYNKNRQKRHARLYSYEFKNKEKVLLFCKILIADLLEE